MFTRRRAIKAAIGAGLIAMPGRPLRAAAGDELAAASPWSTGLGARMRLVRGAPFGVREAFGAGIEIGLDPGFRTYWRMPGEAGVPPVFDWSRSRNLASIAPAWPVPRRFDEAGVSVIGYDGGNVVLPLRIAAADPGSPVEIEVSLVFAACKSICVPEKAEAALALRHDGPEGLYASLIEAAAREVPRRMAAATLGLDRPQAVLLSLAAGGHRSLVLRPALGDEEHILDVFVEGPKNWLFGAPRLGMGGTLGGTLGEVGLPLLDQPKWVDRAADIPFTLTILTNMRAVETTIGTRPAS